MTVKYTMIRRVEIVLTAAMSQGTSYYEDNKGTDVENQSLALCWRTENGTIPNHFMSIYGNYLTPLLPMYIGTDTSHPSTPPSLHAFDVVWYNYLIGDAPIPPFRTFNTSDNWFNKLAITTEDIESVHWLILLRYSTESNCLSIFRFYHFYPQN